MVFSSIVDAGVRGLPELAEAIITLRSAHPRWGPKKLRAVLGAGMQPILCVGETLEERDAGRTEKVVARQLDEVLTTVGIEAFSRAVVAYEPVWAIGTGRTATPEQAQAVHAFIRKRIFAGTPVIYGGSVKADNAAAIFTMPDVDGGLIGGASLVAKDFLAIARAAATKG